MTGTAIAPATVPIPAQLRLGWRIPAILLAVDRCYGRSATWAQLQLLSWVLTQRVAVEDLQERLSGSSTPDDAPVSVDPAVPLAVDRAIGAGLLERRGPRVRLTDRGVALLQLIAAADVLKAEREVLAALGRKLTASDAASVFGER